MESINLPRAWLLLWSTDNCERPSTSLFTASPIWKKEYTFC